VQQNILAKYPHARVRVYTVWFNMLWGDSREGWDSTVLPDARVTHLWEWAEAGGAAGSPRKTETRRGPNWDAYWRMARRRAGTRRRGPWSAMGGPVINVGAQLQSQIVPLLTGPGSWRLPLALRARSRATNWRAPGERRRPRCTGNTGPGPGGDRLGSIFNAHTGRLNSWCWSRPPDRRVWRVPGVQERCWRAFRRPSWP